MKSRYFLNGGEINEPNNCNAIEIEITYEDEIAKETAVLNSWEFGVGDRRNSNDALTIINTYIEKGLTGGVGVTEGIPFKIILDNESGKTYELFDGYIDLWKGSVDSDMVVAPSTEQGKIDWLNDVADSVSFEYLFSINKITTADFVQIPYVINRKANGVEIAVASISLFVLIRNIIQTIHEIILTTNDYDLIFISMIIRVISLVIYLIALIIATIKQIVDLFNMIIQPVKYHYGMYAKDLIRIGLEHFGLKFSSSIFLQEPYSRMVILPEKMNIKFDAGSDTFNFASTIFNEFQEYPVGYFKGTLGSLLRTMKQTFFAKTDIVDGVYYFEPQNYNIKKALYKLPAIESPAYSFNYDEFYSNIVFTFTTDLNDRNTIQEFIGTSVQMIQLPKVINNKGMILTRNLQQISIPFALAKRKVNLTGMEKRLESFNKNLTTSIQTFVVIYQKVMDSVKKIVEVTKKFKKALKVVGINIPFDLNFKSLPQMEKVMSAIKRLETKYDGSRKGMLMMESDYVSIPKVMLLENGTNPRMNVLSSDNEEKLSARYIFERYHKPYKSFEVDPVTGEHGQFVKKNFGSIPFSFEDFEKVRMSQAMQDDENNEGKFLSLKFNPHKQTASGKYKIKKLYTTNIKTQIIEPDGK